MKKINIGIPQENLKKINAFLEALLADENVMYVKIKNFHWNVEGENFFEYHKFLDELAEETEKTSDEIAERMRTLGTKVQASMKNYLAKTSLKEANTIQEKADSMMEILLEDYESSCQLIRKVIESVEKLDDVGTADFLTAILEAKEKRAWMLRSILG